MEWMDGKYLFRTNKHFKGRIKRLVKKETCLYAEEALKYGFVDEII